MQILSSLKNSIVSLLREDDGQGTFEYFMVVGALITVIIGAAAALAWSSTVGAVLDGMCGAIDDTLNWNIGANCG
jgi:hypothetical protein